MKSRILFIISFLLFFACQSLFADLFNHRNILIGERGAMMGGAYTALSTDISGAYYNPAGLAFIDRIVLSMDANMYSYQNYVYKEDSAHPEIILSKLQVIPTSFGINFNVSEKIAIAFTVFAKDNFKFSSTNIQGSTFRSIEYESETTLIGPSFAYRILDNLSLGVSCYFQYYRGKLNTFSDDGGGDVVEQKSEATSGGLAVIFGLKYSPIPNLHLGIMYGMRTFDLYGTNTYYRSDALNPPADSGTVNEYPNRYPHRIALGIAYEKENSFTISFDTIYYFRLEYDVPRHIVSPEDEDVRYIEKGHFDFSLGSEIFFSKLFALRLGFFTNTSGAEDSGLSTGNKVNLFGGSIGLAFVKDDLSSSVGIITMYGSGGSWARRLSVGVIVGATIPLGG